MQYMHNCRVFESMKENGVRPGGKVVHNLIMGSIINGRMDLAQAYAEEFRVNGVKYECCNPSSLISSCSRDCQQECCFVGSWSCFMPYPSLAPIS